MTPQRPPNPITETAAPLDAGGPLFLGIDVGTGSARAGFFTASGDLVASAARPIFTATPRPDFAQQSSADIWAAICGACQAALQDADIAPDRVEGIGIDATCSLVVVGAEDAPVSVCPDATADQDVILWSDHRAIPQAAAIEQTGNAALRSVGGKMSPEMQLPKLLWLQQHLPARLAQAHHLFDLPDWIVYRATGDTTRSLCSATCKWTYQGAAGLAGEGWDMGFLTEIGLGCLTADAGRRIGSAFAAPGTPIGAGLSAQAAAELGLRAGTKVAASLIDAYSGALGTIGVTDQGEETTTAPAPATASADATGQSPAAGHSQAPRMALIAGTSACHITFSDAAKFVPGVWGPYLGVIFPESWANEAGQSACGALIDRILDAHPATAALTEQARIEGHSIHAKLEQILSDLAAGPDATHALTRSLNLQPDFAGNRSPLADPTRRGAISGLTMATGAEDLALLYLATVQALAYGTRQIVDRLRTHGVVFDALVVSGGLARNPLFLREHADAIGCPVLVPEQAEPVLLGSAMLGACAAGQFGSLAQAAQAMSGTARRIAPRGGSVAAYHDAKYAIFLKMQRDMEEYAAIMDDLDGA